MQRLIKSKHSWESSALNFYEFCSKVKVSLNADSADEAFRSRVPPSSKNDCITIINKHPSNHTMNTWNIISWCFARDFFYVEVSMSLSPTVGGVAGFIEKDVFFNKLLHR